MIKNEREYRITKAHLAGFEGGLTANDEREFTSNVDPGMKQLMHNAIASQIETFRHEIDHYRSTPATGATSCLGDRPHLGFVHGAPAEVEAPAPLDRERGVTVELFIVVGDALHEVRGDDATGVVLGRGPATGHPIVAVDGHDLAARERQVTVIEPTSDPLRHRARAL
jgi:hypothetical protein